MVNEYLGRNVYGIYLCQEPCLIFENWTGLKYCLFMWALPSELVAALPQPPTDAPSCWWRAEGCSFITLDGFIPLLALTTVNRAH